MNTLKVYGTYDQQLINELPLLTEQQVEEKLANAYALFNDRTRWLAPFERIAVLEKSLAIVKKNRETYIVDAAREGGKPYTDSAVEIDRAIYGIQQAIEGISQLNGEQIPMGLTPSATNRLAFTIKEPRGVVLAISAFNHPFNLIVHQIIPAIAVGCPVLVKPASSTPNSCINLVNALHEAGLPDGWCQTLITETAFVEKLVADPRIQFMTFIGSGKVGWYLRSKLAPGAQCTLEHGGAAPVIIEADADLKDAIPLLTKGGFYHAGQVCVSVQRIYAHEKICDTVANGITELAKKLITGDATDPKTEVGPLISTKEVDRIDEWVKEAVAAGAKLLCGGKKISDTCYQPTVLLNPPEDCKVSQLEIFGPVICVYSYKNFDDAIARANALPFAFQSSIFTKNIDKALAGVKQLDANTVLVNDQTAFRVDWMPFGGRKESGLGLGGIHHTMAEMTFEKMMVLRSEALG